MFLNKGNEHEHRTTRNKCISKYYTIQLIIEIGPKDVPSSTTGSTLRTTTPRPTRPDGLSLGAKRCAGNRGVLHAIALGACFDAWNQCLQWWRSLPFRSAPRALDLQQCNAPRSTSFYTPEPIQKLLLYARLILFGQVWYPSQAIKL